MIELWSGTDHFVTLAGLRVERGGQSWATAQLTITAERGDPPGMLHHLYGCRSNQIRVTSPPRQAQSVD